MVISLNVHFWRFAVQPGVLFVLCVVAQASARMSVLLSCIPDLRLVLGAVAAVLVVRHLLTRRAQNARKAELKARAQRKLAQRNAKLQQWTDDWAALSAGDGADIVQLTAWELQRELRSGTLTAVEVMRAFCARAKLCGEQLDVLAEEDFARAMEQAKKADEARAQGKFLGPLHGLPFSVKDQLDMEGMDSTLGLQVMWTWVWEAVMRGWAWLPLGSDVVVNVAGSDVYVRVGVQGGECANGGGTWCALLSLRTVQAIPP